MKTTFLKISFALLLLTACSKQDPAEILYKGAQFFGHSDRERERPALDSSDNQTYSKDSPRYKPDYVHPAEPAPAPAVSVSELPPPSAGKAAARIEDNAPSAGGNGAHVLSIKQAEKVEVQEQQVADISQDTPKVFKVSAASKESSKFIWPVDGGKVISRFESGKKGNDGINISMAEGEPIFSSAAGTVVYAGNELQGYGNMVIVRHADGWMTAYAHARNLSVKKGDKVKQGDPIAYVGTTGNVKKPQLHFVLRKNKTPVNPEEYLPHAG